MMLVRLSAPCVCQFLQRLHPLRMRAVTEQMGRFLPSVPTMYPSSSNTHTAHTSILLPHLNNHHLTLTNKVYISLSFSTRISISVPHIDVVCVYPCPTHWWLLSLLFDSMGGMCVSVALGAG